MIPLFARALVALIVCTSAVAQERDDARSLLRPITGNVHERAVRLDPQTGRAVRLPAGTIHNDGMSTVYSNTCPTGYYTGLNAQTAHGPPMTIALGDWGMLPSTAAAASATCTTGSADTYEIVQFTVGYCTTDGVPIDMIFNFWNAPQNACMTPAPGGTLISNGVPTVATITVTGLPRSSAVIPNAAACYAVQFTLGTPGFDLDGGIDGLRDLTLDGDRFAWSIHPTTGTGGAGPIMAGNASFGSPCSFCVGTIWEVGGPFTSGGIGLGQSNVFFLETFGSTAPNSGDCFWFGGNPWGGAYLVLDAWKPGVPAGTFCDDSDGSLASCPCANPGAPGTGCDNAQGTGGVALALVAQTTAPNGATLSGSGFSTMGSPTAIVIRSNALDPSSPVVFGDGLRCVNTSPLVRLAATTAAGGTSVHAVGHGAMAGAGSFYYQLWYRNTPSTYCDPFAAYNLSSGREIVW